MDKLSVFEPIEGVRFIATSDDLKEYVKNLADNFKNYVKKEEIKKEKESVPNDFNGFLRYVARVYFDGDLKFTKKFFNALRNINPCIAFALGSWILAKLVDKNYETNIFDEKGILQLHWGGKKQEHIFGCVRTKEEGDKILRVLQPISKVVYAQSKNKECQK